MGRSADINSYKIRSGDGTEAGPLTAEELVTRTLAGEITEETPVRPALLPTWKPAREYSFLSGKFQVPVSAAAKPLRAGAEPAPVTPLTNRIGAGIFEFTPAPISLRLAAGLTDLLLVLIPVYVGLLACERLRLPGQDLGSAPATSAVVVLAGVMLLYWTAAYGFRGQTPGQWYWGLMIVRKDGREVWLGRAFAAALATLFTGLLMPLFVHASDSRRSCSDFAAGVRVIRTRVVTKI